VARVQPQTQKEKTQHAPVENYMVPLKFIGAEVEKGTPVGGDLENSMALSYTKISGKWLH
jgi:hypothetical protein